MKRSVRRLGALLVIALLTLPVGANEVPYRSYVYDVWENPVSTPQPYRPGRALSGLDLGTGLLRNPSDLQVTDDGRMAIADTGNDRIVVYDLEARRLQRIIDSFRYEGGEQQLSRPEGVYIHPYDGTFYIADTGNRRIVVLTPQGSVERIITAPEAEVIRDDYDFLPTKVAADVAGRTYTLGPGMFEGVMEFDQSGSFQGFMGSNRVSFDPWDWFMRQISTDEQRERMRLFIPEEFSNIDIDADGFIYAVTSEEESQFPVKKINFLGLDILRREGFFVPQGDVEVTEKPEATHVGPSMLMDVCVDAAGMYMVLDGKRGRIFGYDEEGHLLYVFGGTGTQTGTFVSPVALDTYRDQVLVLDRSRGSVTTFHPTEYGRAIRQAVMFHWRGDYDMAAFTWQEVLSVNQHLSLAHTGVGKALLRNHQYEQAIRHFELGNDRTYYSKAFKKLRRERIRAAFGVGATILMVILGGAAIGKAIYRRYVPARPKNSRRSTASSRLLPQLKYSLYIMAHPFDGYYDMRFVHGGNMLAAVLLFLAFVASLLTKLQFTGFVFLDHNVESLNLFRETAKILAPFLLFVISNWTVTSILDGKGNLRDIFMSVVYALVPVVLFYPLLTVFSNVLVEEEEGFYRLMEVLPVVWAAFLLFIGNLTIHQYTISKTVGTLVLTVVTMAIILFLSLLLVTFLEQVYAFVVVIFRELRFRV